MRKVVSNQRTVFANALYGKMVKNKDVFLLVGDLGFGVFDQVLKDFPDRAFNVGASEQAMLDIAVGLAYQGRIPFCYSIATFLLYRAFETLRTYINHEKLPVKLVASGRGKDYLHDGISHWSEDAKYFLDGLPNIKQIWPEYTYPDIPDDLDWMIKDPNPNFISLRR